MTELRHILALIEADDANIDQLATLVERAATLIHFCRERILQTEIKLKSLIPLIEDADSTD